MEIRKHPNCNFDFGAPADMQDGSCATLPVILYTDAAGTWAQSFFQPNAEQLAALNAGGALTLFVRTSGEPGLPPGHPVVGLGVTSDATEPA